MRRVYQIMSRRVVAVAEADRLSTVKDIMTLGDVSHMPVVRAGCLVGVVSETDLCAASLSSPESGVSRSAQLDTVSISQIMSSPAIVVDGMASIRQAADVMTERRIGCLPVVNEAGAVEGMVTESDLLRFIAKVH